MPSRNIVKKYDADCYYHVYNRGVEKRKIFIDDEDYSVFVNLFKRYLSDKPTKDSKGREYNWLSNDVELVAFCLMPNHFHMLLYQMEIGAITKLMRSICSTYTIYFNKKYNRVGTLSQAKFKASKIDSEVHLIHVSRYIHRNPKDYMEWEWSSLGYWMNSKKAEWVKPERLCDMSIDKYVNYIKDEDGYTSTLDDLLSVIY